jgi:hypothetical protein
MATVVGSPVSQQSFDEGATMVSSTEGTAHASLFAPPAQSPEGL